MNGCWVGLLCGLICWGPIRGEEAFERGVWESLLAVSSGEARIELLKDGIEAETEAPKSWLALWEDEPSRPYLLEMLSLQELQELLQQSELARWSSALRRQLWGMGIKDAMVGELVKEELWKEGVDEGGELEIQMKEALKNKMNGSNPDEVEQRHRFTHKVQELRVSLQKDWSWDRAEEILRTENWTELRAVADTVLEKNLKIPDKMISTFWNSASHAGRTTLSYIFIEQKDLRVVDTLESSFKEGQAQVLCLKVVRSLGDETKTRWLPSQLRNLDPEDPAFSLSLALLNEGSEVESSSVYADLFTSKGYEEGGPSGEVLILLMGRSKHASVVPLLTKELRRRQSPYDFTVVVTAMGYHGAQDFVKVLNEQPNADQAPLVQWALGRIRGSVAPPPIESNDGHGATSTFSFGRSP